MSILLSQAYPISDFASSASLQFQTITGDSEFRCAVSPDRHLSATGSLQFFLAWDHGRKVQRKCYIMGISVQPEKSHFESDRCWAYRWELDDVQRIQYWVRGFMRLLFRCFSSKILIPMPALMDRLLSAQWLQPRMPLLQNWLPIGSHLSVLATQINTDYLAHLSGLCTKVLHALFYSKAQVLQQLSVVVL